MEKPKRARRRKLDTAKADLEPPLAVSGGQRVHREVESDGHEENSLIDKVTKDAMRKIWKEIQSGREWIVDADLKDFFGSVDSPP